MIYVAPAARPFLEAHIKDEKRKPRASACHGGWTRCGKLMDREELWVEMKVAETDPVCPNCAAGRRIEVKRLALW